MQTTLKNKIIIALGVMLLLLVALAALSVYFLQNMNDTIHELAQGMAESFQPVTRLQILVLEAIYSPHHYLIYGYPEEHQLFSHLSREVDKAFADTLAISDTTEKRELVVSAQEEWQQVRTLSEVILGLSHPRREPITTQEMEDLHVHIDRVVYLLNEIHDLAVREADERHEQAHANAHRAQLITIVVSGVGLGIAVVAVIVLIGSILVPLRLLEKAANHFGKGNLSHRVPLVSKDEMGNLGRTFNAMAENLAKSQVLLKELATHDSLTGHYNHREFYQRLEAETKRSKRYGHSLSLLMIDIDHFKTLNDTYGHQAGDSALHAIGSLIGKEIRLTDQAARYGGDEFAIILPETPASVALSMAERLRKSIAIQGITINEGQVVNITVSIGAAAFPEDACSGEELVAAADQALYAAKQAGSNRVCLGRYQS